MQILSFFSKNNLCILIGKEIKKYLYLEIKCYVINYPIIFTILKSKMFVKKELCFGKKNMTVRSLCIR